MNIKLDHLKVFAAVVDSGTLADAGIKLSRSPSAISMTLHQIEMELDGALFEGDRKSQLTKLGEYLYKRTQRILGEHGAMMTDVERFARGDEGVIRMAAVPSVANQLLPKTLAKFRASNLKVEIELRDTDSTNVADLVRSGVVDIGIASLPMDPSGLETEFLLEDPFKLVCPQNHQLAQKCGDIAFTDLTPDEFIANGLCQLIVDPEFLSLLQSATLTVHNTTSLLSFVREGLGVTILPELAVSSSEGLASLGLENFATGRQLWILTRSDESLHPAALRLLNDVRTTIEELKQEGLSCLA